MKHKKMPIEVQITDTRRKILRAAHQLIKRERIPPTITEIAQLAELSFGAVQSNLFALQAGEYLVRRDGTARSIRLLPRAYEVLGVSAPEEVRA